MPGASCLAARGGCISTGAIGVAGALIAGFVAERAGFGDPIDHFFDISTWIAAIVGAALLLVVWGIIAGRNS